MKRIYILCQFVRNVETAFGYYASLNSAKKALIRKEKDYGDANLICSWAAPIDDEEEARYIHYQQSREYYGRLYIKSAELND